jgi:hypothetical protein
MGLRNGPRHVPPHARGRSEGFGRFGKGKPVGAPCMLAAQSNAEMFPPAAALNHLHAGHGRHRRRRLRSQFSRRRISGDISIFRADLSLAAFSRRTHA